MKNTNNIIVKNVCNGTFTNADGMSLFLTIDSSLKDSNNVLLSFSGINSVSSSFLNSSIGSIIEKYGINVMKDNIKISNFTPTIATILKKYIEQFTVHQFS